MDILQPFHSVSQHEVPSAAIVNKAGVLDARARKGALLLLLLLILLLLLLLLNPALDFFFFCALAFAISSFVKRFVFSGTAATETLSSHISGNIA